MHSILVVENSATQRYGLCRSLEDQGYQVDSAQSFEAGLMVLTENGVTKRYHALVLGWPDPYAHEMDVLLAALSEVPLCNLPVLVLAMHHDPAKLAWVASRAHTAFLNWKDHLATSQTLNRLLSISPPPVPVRRRERNPTRILLVDDSPTARVKFCKLLERDGYHVDTAASVDEAHKKAAAGNIDIAIIDFFMPEMNGDHLVRRLQADPATRNILCSILTSTYLDRVISDCLTAGAMECMFKSESDELFLARVAVLARMVGMTLRIDRKQQRLASILSSVGDGVYGVNHEGIITFANPAASHLLGFSREQLLCGIRPMDLFHHCQPGQQHSAAANHLNRAIHQGLPTDALETVFDRIDGTRIQVELSVQPLVNDGNREGAVVAFRDISERKLLEEELKWQANHDPLTKLLNRTFLDDVLSQEVIRMGDENITESSALLYLDLDRFKYINDTIGHAAGDRLLVEISQQLQSRLHEGELLARIGGDEFAILIRNVDEAKLFATADKFRECLEDYTFLFARRAYNIHGSIGVARIENATTSAGEVLSNADLACHIAKGKGRNQTHIFNQNEDEKAVMDMELGWSIRLKQALQNDRFCLLYQPIVALDDIDLDMLDEYPDSLWPALQQKKNDIEVIYEVLLRLPDNRGELISPNAFLPTAERFNMMSDIDIWVVNAAFTALAEYNSRCRPLRLSINLSGQGLDHHDMLESILIAMRRNGLEPQDIMFEVTESCAINQLATAGHCIQKLREEGCRFALDDFGSGYSTFSQLKQLPVDVIKIDGQFVKDITHDEMDREIVTSMANIARSLGKKTVAEFVESADVLRLLQICGVDYVQGNYICEPLGALPEILANCDRLVD